MRQGTFAEGTFELHTKITRRAEFVVGHACSSRMQIGASMGSSLEAS